MVKARFDLAGHLRALSDAQAILFLSRQPDDVLQLIQRRWVCDCDLPRLPCPVHGKQDCDCHTLPDQLGECPKHGRDNPLSPAAQEFLRQYLHPELYAEPPPPPVPCKALVREAKALALAERAHAGWGLYNRGDYLRRYRRGELEMADLLDGEREVTTRETNPEAPANGAPLAKPFRRRHERAD